LNKKLIGLGMLLAANGAFAQATGGTNSIELYGVLDAAVGYEEYSLNASSDFPSTVNPLSATKTSVSHAVTGMFNGGIQDSRWGLRGTEDLGGGMKAFFTLESGINVSTGQVNNAAQSLAANSPSATGASANSSLDGQLFTRQAFVGLSSDTLGSVAFGRNYAPEFDIAVAYDPVQNAQLFSPLGFSGTIGGGGGVSEDTRVDNSIKYKNKIGDFNFGGLYKFGGVAGNSTAEGGWALNAGYEAGPFGIQAAYEAFKDALKTGSSTAVGSAGEVTATAYNTSSFMIAAKYSFGEATIRGGFEDYVLKAASDSIASLGVTSLYGYPVASASAFGGANQTTDVWFIGGDYNFTPALNLAVGFYDQNPKKSDDYVAAAGTTLPKTGQADGNIYSYSLLLDYHFSKRTDVYYGLMYSQYKGDNYPSTTYNDSNYVTAVGIRHKF
jgi:GBP family porin